MGNEDKAVDVMTHDMLRERKVLVTGGGTRIGAAICRAFAAAGSRVAMHYHRSEPAALALLEELGGRQAGHAALKGDLTDPSLVENLLHMAGGAEILVNNASIFGSTPLAEESPAHAQEQFAVNFWAPLRLMTLFHLQHIANGCVVNLLDQRIAGTDPQGGGYTLSKKALAEATVMAAVQWAPRTRVNAVAPGPILPPKGMEGSAMRVELSKTALGRRIAPAEVADACVYLAATPNVTGQILYIDGGRRFSP